MLRLNPILIAAAILFLPFLLINLLKFKHEKHTTSGNVESYLDDEWEKYTPESGPTEKWSIEPLISNDYRIMQKLESFSVN